MLRLARGVLPLLILACPLNAQSSESSATSRALEFLKRHNAVGVVMGSFVSRISIEVTEPAPCEFSLAVRTSSRSGRTQAEPDLDVSALPLSQLSIDAPVRAWEQGGLFSVDLRIASGDSAILVRRTMGSRPPVQRRTYRTELVVDTREAADSLALLMIAAIRECGGRSLTPDAKARLDAADSAASASTDRLLGNSLSPEVRSAALTACHDQVRTRLRAPSTARFDAADRASFTVDPKSDELTILGSVEAQNAAGGRVGNSYLCVLEKIGSRYIPKSTSVF